jgi:K+-transporting ATPase ATPase C chain
MLKELRASLTLFALMLLLTGLIYPLVTLGLGQILFPWHANGSLITDQGKVIGSALIAQGFAMDKYFHPRPSAAGQGYDAANSGGSNLAPTSPDLAKAVEDRVTALKSSDNGVLAPVDLVTASASGLDPDISVEAAQLQAARVASARHESLMRVTAIITEHTQDRTFGALGEPRVNVLELNRALDTEAPPLSPEEP